MDKKQEHVLIGLGVLVVVVIIVGFVFFKSSGPAAPRGAQTATPQGFVNSNPNALPTVQGGTREKVTTQIATPGVNATGTPANIAIPTTVQQTGAIASRDFTVTGAGGKFSPDTIVVNEGDVISLTLKAADGTYNIFFPDFGVTLAAQKGGTATAQFQPSIYGQYVFSCTVCKGTVTGTLIVNQKQ